MQVEIRQNSHKKENSLSFNGINCAECGSDDLSSMAVGAEIVFICLACHEYAGSTKGSKNLYNKNRKKIKF